MNKPGKVGIIANPDSGKDIRRIVAQGWVVTNQEKVAITRRLLAGLEAAEVGEVLFMPETRSICLEAIQTLGKTRLKTSLVNIPITGRQQDSTAAARAMVQQGVSCIITLGGDGTNRAVFKGSGPEVPLLPVSTGTNNVFPEFQEGTTAGYAAGLFATGQVSLAEAGWRSKVILLKRGASVIDLALVDLAITSENVIGSRAIWDVANLRELLLTRAQPENIGLSAIGGFLHPITPAEPLGLHLVFGLEGQKIKAPIGPGLFKEVTIARCKTVKIQEEIILKFDRQSILAFDGERDLITKPGEELVVELNAGGPWVLSVPTSIKTSVLQKFQGCNLK
jgi:predicted polyphosphate/ATP-dependent NAD kinase